MSLKDTWKNKTDGVDDVLAEDINSIAEAVIEIEESGVGSAEKSPYIGDNGNWYEWNDIQQGYVDTGVKANGEDGYTPQRGIDYWTDADKAEIKGYVDEAILGGAW